MVISKFQISPNHSIAKLVHLLRQLDLKFEPVGWVHFASRHLPELKKEEWGVYE